MGAAAGPKVIQEGLVFAMDQANTEKSWKGAPTTNLRPDATFNSMNSIIHTYIETDAEGWKKYSLSGTWSAGTYPYCSSISSVTFTLGTYYSTGVYIKCNCMDKFFYKWTGMNYVNVAMNDGGTSFSIPQPDGSLFVGRRGFNYTTTTTQTGYFLNRPLADGTVFDPSTDFVWMKDPQIELGNFCTPFTASTRSNTEAIEDLTGNNTITASSLTYNADGSFEFNGTSDYIDCGNNSILKSEYTTVSTWILCNSLISGSRLISDWHQVATGDRWILYANTTSTIQWYIHSSVGADVGISYTMPLGAWVNLVGTFDGTNTVYYANGTLVDSVAKTGIMVSGSGGTIRIGKQLETGGYQNGKINNVTIYNRALTAAEVKQNFEATRSRYGI
jgi:hypothetical protein